MPQDPKPSQSSVGTTVIPQGDNNYWQPYRPYVQPYVPPTQTVWSFPVQDADAGRMRFALELIADGKLTKEAMEKIATAALRKDAKK